MGRKRKSTAERKTPPSKGRPGRKSVAAPSPVAAPAASSPSPVAVEVPEPAASSATVLAGGAVAVAAAEGEVMKLYVPKTMLRCDECHGTLKPPVYQCSLMQHVACSDCCGNDDSECYACIDEGASAAYFQNPYLDILFGYIKAACPYKKYGCTSSVACRDTAAHVAVCLFAPCSCPLCFCEGSSADLVRHLTEVSGGHAWTPHKIMYGQDYLYVPDELSSSGSTLRFDLLVAEEDGGAFFLVVDVTEEDFPFPFVTLLCVRNRAGAAAGPVYSYSVAAEAPRATRRKLKLETHKAASCLDWRLDRDCLPLLPGMLREEQTRKSLRMRICISKTQSSSASC